MQKRMLLILALMTAATVAAADETQSRLSFGATRAPALEALIPNLYPGARLEWEPRLTVLFADGTRKPLRVADAVSREEPDGYTFVMPLEFTDTEAKIAQALDALTPSSDTSLTEIVAFKTTKQFAVTAVRRALLPETAVATRASSIELADVGGDAVWPSVYLEYQAFYGTSDWVGQLDWNSKVVTDPQISFVYRLPSFVAKSTKNGAQVSDRPQIIVNDDDSLSLYTSALDRLIIRCPDPCVPDGKVLLGLW